jgi:hypothetical protein
MFISEGPFYSEQPYAFPVEFFSKFQSSTPNRFSAPGNALAFP